MNLRVYKIILLVGIRTGKLRNIPDKFPHFRENSRTYPWNSRAYINFRLKILAPLLNSAVVEYPQDLLLLASSGQSNLFEELRRALVQSICWYFRTTAMIDAAMAAVYSPPVCRRIPSSSWLMVWQIVFYLPPFHSYLFRPSGAPEFSDLTLRVQVGRLFLS